MNGLPNITYKHSAQQTVQTAFGGLNSRASAEDGEIVDMVNMTSDEYPMLSPRKPRELYETSSGYNGMFSLDGLVTVTKTHVYYKDMQIGVISDSVKTITALGSKVVILPDKVYFDTAADAPELLNIEAQVINIKATFQNGKYAGEEAKANTIYADVEWNNYFKVGDAVTISGAFLHAENNKTLVIREIDRNYLRFYEYSFVIGEDGNEETITVSRSMPDIDYICESDNRLWGCKGDTVYASKLGDLTNWNVFDGIASDSYAVDVGSPGDFTGCITYLGYPTFFKEDVIYKVYGSQPSNFKLIRSASLGVAPDNSRSLAISGEVLFYMSRTGIVGYSGSTPYDIFLPFDNEKYTDCIAGSDGRKYYVSMKRSDSTRILAVYDTSFKTWHLEDNSEVVAFSYFNELYMMTPRIIYKFNAGDETVTSAVEFADTTLSSPQHKSLQKIGLRCTVPEEGSLTVYVKYDSLGEWQKVKTLEGNSKRSYYLPVIPHRCDHFKIRLEGTGAWKLHSITREFSVDSKKGR